jgi:xeroderma pigmentosum group C-complementing protein
MAAMHRGGVSELQPLAQPEMATAREDRELNARAAIERQGLPTTIEGFRSHATFVLARHIGKYQALRPGSKAMGMHRGEPYYLKEDVGEVHTAERWRRLGREVVPDELDYPTKRIKKRGSNGDKKSTSDLDDDSSQAAGEMSKFYGEWQTREYTPPGAVDGKVPKNDRGNVEAPPLAATLPRGTVRSLCCVVPRCLFQ